MMAIAGASVEDDNPDIGRHSCGGEPAQGGFPEWFPVVFVYHFAGLASEVVSVE